MPEDSVESIKAKFVLTDEEWHQSRLRMLFHDFLDMDSMNDPLMKQRREAFHEEFGDDNSYEYAVVVKDIIDKGDDYEIVLSLGEDELEGIQDWAGWADLTEVYGVTIYADLYDFGTKPGYCGTTIHELVDGEVKTTKVEPSLDTEGFYKDFSTLIDLYPGRYKDVLVEALENEIEQLQEMARTCRLSVIKDNLKANDGHAEIPEGWTEIEGYAFNYNKLTSVSIGSGIQYIDYAAFSKNSSSNPNLSSITINRSCSDIKNIPASSTDSTEYYPWLSSSSPYTASGVTIYGTGSEVCDSY